MGEMSDYFEDFPEENPANYDENGNPLDRQETERLRIANEKLDDALRRSRQSQAKASPPESSYPT
jgi:hypothetical protein